MIYIILQYLSYLIISNHTTCGPELAFRPVITCRHQKFPVKGAQTNKPIVIRRRRHHRGAMVFKLSLLLLLNVAVESLQLPLSPAQRQVRRLLGKERELAKSQDLLRSILAEQTTVQMRQAQQLVATELIKSTSGLDRGSAASAEDAARVEASVQALEATSPCTLAGPALIDALAGSSWRLVYASSFVPGSGTPEASGGGLGLRSMVDMVAMTSPVSLGAVTQRFSAARLEDTVSVALPMPWPLPKRTLSATFEQTIDATGAPGGLTARLEKVTLNRGGEERLLGPSFLRSAELPVPREQLGAALGRFPPTQALEVGELGITCSVALLDGATRVSVLRSALGDLRVFAATTDSPGGPEEAAAAAAAAAAATAAAAAYLDSTADGREGSAAGTMVGRVVPTDRVAGAGAPAVADEEAYMYNEEFWVDGDEVGGDYSSKNSELGL